MKLDIYRENNLVIIRIIGRFDINQVHLFESAFIDQVESNPAVIAVRMKECTYIDSSAIVTFVRFLNMARRKGIEMVCYDLNENIDKIFRISKLDAYLKVMTERQFLDKYANE